jgi:hypothetical protein
MRGAHHDRDHGTAAMQPGRAACVRKRLELSHLVSSMPRSCQRAGVPGPAQRTRCQSGAATARWRALSRALAPIPLSGVAGPAQGGRVPVSGDVVAGLAAGLRERTPDGRDPAESPGHRPSLARRGSQGQPESLLLSRQPRASQRNDLCMDLWTIWVNAQASHCIAVDTRGCGKVDNRTAHPCQAAAYRCPRGVAAAAGTTAGTGTAASGVAAPSRVTVLQRRRPGWPGRIQHG